MPTTSQRSSTSLFPDGLVGSQLPRIGTARSQRPTSADRLIALARLIGIDLDPWQRHVLAVSLELDPSGHLAYRYVGLIVARQNGKTTILEVRILGGLFILGDSKIVHTAQDRALPRQMFESLVGYIESVPALSRRVQTIRETNGQEHIRLKSGGIYKIIAPRAKAIRGEYEPSPPSLIVFDEAREQRSMDLWAAAVPTIRTMASAQIISASNAGDAGSVMLNSLRDRGRTAVDAPDSDPRMAWLEWSAAGGIDRPADDPQAWIEANPALGRRFGADTVRDELVAYTDDPDGFRTEILCQWVTTAGYPAIPYPAWLAAGTNPDPIEPGSLPRPVAALDVNGDRTHAALCIAAVRDGKLVLDQVEEWSGDDVTSPAVAESCVEWFRAFHIREWAYDPFTASTIAAGIETRRGPGVALRSGDLITAAGNLFDAVRSGYVAHPNNPSLSAQVEAATRKNRGDGLWLISRAESPQPVSGVLAAAFCTFLTYKPTVPVTIQ